MATFNREQMIQSGNEALFQLRSSREKHNAFVAFLSYKKPVGASKPREFIEVPKGESRSSSVYDYYYGNGR